MTPKPFLRTPFLRTPSLQPPSLQPGPAIRTQEPIRADERYLKAQPLPAKLVRALANHERVYVSGKPHRVKSMGISENGQIIGKLEPVTPSKHN